MASPLPRVGLAFVLFALLTGCGRRETSVDTAVRTQTLHFGNSAEPATLDPHVSTMMVEWMVQTTLFEGLVNMANDGVTVLPGVAERWEISADGLTYTFHLRREARWSNGDALTAKDFVASLRRMLNPALGFSSPELIDAIVGARDYLSGKSTDFSSVGIRALDPHTLQYRLAYRAPYFLVVLSNTNTSGMPVHLPSLEQFGGLERRDGKWALPGKLVGNGAFVLKEWRQNQFISVTRNERYWDAKRVRLSEVRFYPIEEAGAEERAFRTGQLHTTWALPPSKVETYQRTRAADLHRAPVLHTAFLSFNCSRPPFNDPRVRRAFALAVDRRSATDAGFRRQAEPARSFVRPGTGGFEPPELKLHDPEEAKRLLSAAGFPGGRGFPAVEFRIGSGGSDTTAVAEALQQMWKQVLGVNVPLLRTEGKVLIASLYAHDFNVALSGYYYAFNDPSDPLTHAAKDSPSNFSTWHDPRFEAASRDVKQAASNVDRLAAFARMETILAEEAPYLPLFHVNRVHLVHPSVQGWRDNSFAQVDWRELWLEASK